MNAIEAKSNGRSFKAGVNAVGVAYLQCQFADGTIQELHISNTGAVESVFFDGTDWKLNGIMVTKDELGNYTRSFDLGPYTLSQMFDLNSSYSKPAIGILPWNHAENPSANTMYVALSNGSLLGFSVTGKTYYANRDTGSWTEK